MQLIVSKVEHSSCFRLAFSLLVFDLFSTVFHALDTFPFCVLSHQHLALRALQAISLGDVIDGVLPLVERKELTLCVCPRCVILNYFRATIYQIITIVYRKKVLFF
jgi:hypothetical protein